MDKTKLPKKCSSKEIQKFVDDLIKVCVKHNKKFGVVGMNIKAAVKKNRNEVAFFGQCDHLRHINLNINPEEVKYTLNEELVWNEFQTPTFIKSKEKDNDGRN
ncbi:hypothetical protein LCGC14_1718900 [marine sediment metagenome]|uniref:Uncharacterized protein n=1 Tax=marine sediment metagenome TaxID=412755 RepID=A0A0F9HDB3_9ZZZZ